ncbi:peptidylprolyl isomerase [Silvibacterium acidisoli]|uniref:peptidylprolyl isomerase n=1 Tax=Acidobacteriaceae bacterium ZG23-2 TaxID=2883246 RepID=UPI00406C7C89
MNRVAVYALMSLLCLPGLGQPTSRHATPEPLPTGPIAVIDTSQGRITCRLFSKEAPEITANFVGLATGSKDWKDQATGQTMHGVPFYDATAIMGASDSIVAGDRLGNLKGVAGDPLPMEKTGLTFDRGGRLAMAGVDGKVSSSMFSVTAHANMELASRAGEVVFGQCDDASQQVAHDISHQLLATDNHPSRAVAIRHIAIVQPGQPLPHMAPDVDPLNVVPQPVPVPVNPIPAPEPTGPTALINTTEGRFTCRLFEETPKATGTFTGLATGTMAWHDPKTKALMHGHFYEGLHFNRVLPDFMIQNQDYPHEDPLKEDAGTGIKYSIEPIDGLLFDRPGRLAMANAGPDTNDSEFFITEVPVSRLNAHYTIFGQCDDASVALAQKIANLPRDKNNRPLKPVTITKVSIVRKTGPAGAASAPRQ